MAKESLIRALESEGCIVFVDEDYAEFPVISSGDLVVCGLMAKSKSLGVVSNSDKYINLSDRLLIEMDSGKHYAPSVKIKEKLNDNSSSFEGSTS